MDSLNAAPVLAPGFAIDLHRQLARDGGNLALSPLSAAATLAMVLAGARGDTAREVETVLRLADRQGDVHAAFAVLFHDLAAEGGAEGPALTIANRIWAADNAPLEGAFAALVRDHYRSEIGQEDFGDATGVARVINAWVEEATCGRIRDVVRENDIPEEASFVLVNAVYFLGTWEKPFDPSRTLTAPFWLDGSSSVHAHMMSQLCRDALYAAGGGWEAIELPYCGGRLAMDLIKPALERDSDEGAMAALVGSKTQPPRLVQSLEDLETSWSVASLTEMLNGFRPTWLEVSLPRFDVDASLELSDALNQLGMNKAFRPGEADFSGAVRGKPAWIGLIRQRCRLRVDERGTEAAAATVAVKLMGGPPSFVANHPFLFLIRDTRTGAVLFMGRVANPTGGSGPDWGAGQTTAGETPVSVSHEPPRRKSWWQGFW